MKNILILFFCAISQLQAQTPLTGTNWYLTKIEENNQIETVPISINGTTPGNWLFMIYPLPSANDLGSTYCFSFGGGIILTATSFNFVADIALTLNAPCEWMTNEEIQYFAKYYNFFKNYENDTFTYIIQNNQLVITNNAGNKAYYSNVPLSVEEPLEQFIKVYPNPFEDHLFIEDSEGIIKTIKIFDNTGRIIKTVSEPTQAVREIHTNFASGIYFINIETKDGRIMNKKMIKK